MKDSVLFFLQLNSYLPNSTSSTSILLPLAGRGSSTFKETSITSDSDIWAKMEATIVLSHFSHVWLFTTPWTVALQPLLPMGFSRLEYWNGCHFLLHWIFLTQGSNPSLLCLLNWQAGSWPLTPSGKSWLLFRKGWRILPYKRHGWDSSIRK